MASGWWRDERVRWWSLAAVALASLLLHEYVVISSALRTFAEAPRLTAMLGHVASGLTPLASAILVLPRSTRTSWSQILLRTCIAGVSVWILPWAVVTIASGSTQFWAEGLLTIGFFGALIGALMLAPAAVYARYRPSAPVLFVVGVTAFTALAPLSPVPAIVLVGLGLWKRDAIARVPWLDSRPRLA